MGNMIFRDEDILNQSFRAAIIEEIQGNENKKRKSEAFMRYEIFRDKVRKYVIDRLASQGFEDETLAVMNARASNISIAKKIVKKKARSYNAGVDRTIPSDELGTMSVQELSKILEVTEAFKKGDEYINLSRNAVIYCHPIIDSYSRDRQGFEKPMYSLNLRTLSKHLFDVIPSSQDRTKAKCVILSDYPAGAGNLGTAWAQSNWDGSRNGGYQVLNDGDGIDQVIADSPSDSGANKKHYIWWTDKYHFTTDEKGQIILKKSPENLLNPIQRMPFVQLSKDQDGEFWGIGGDDIIEGTILINIFLTDAAAILNMQGWGQAVLISQNQNKGDYQVGPQKVLEITYDQKSEKPEFRIESNDPHTDSWIKAMEVYIALLLTTNNLSPRNIQGKLEASTVASGIAKMIDESESTDDITEAQSYFQKRERELWTIISEWLNVFRPTEKLVVELDTLPEFQGSEVNVVFKQQAIILSETEKLEALKMRKELGINTMLDLIKRDDPSLTDEEAEKKLLKIAEEQLKKQVVVMAEKQEEEAEGEDVDTIA